MMCSLVVLSTLYSSLGNIKECFQNVLSIQIVIEDKETRTHHNTRAFELHSKKYKCVKIYGRYYTVDVFWPIFLIFLHSLRCGKETEWVFYDAIVKISSQHSMLYTLQLSHTLHGPCIHLYYKLTYLYRSISTFFLPFFPTSRLLSSNTSAYTKLQ